MLNLSKEEIEKPRSAKQLLPWVISKLEELASTPEGQRAIRLREGLAKDLVEEALPLGIFSEKHFKGSRCVRIQHVLGNQNFDAIIKDRRLKKSSLKFIEITQAHEGENAHLRMIHLEEKGHTSILGKVKKSGTKNTGLTIEIESEAVSHNSVVDSEIERIHDAAQRKSDKQYPDNTGLVIVCEDYIAFRDEDDIDRLTNYVTENILVDLTNFREIFIVGWSSRLFLQFTPNAT